MWRNLTGMTISPRGSMKLLRGRFSRPTLHGSGFYFDVCKLKFELNFVGGFCLQKSVNCNRNTAGVVYQVTCTAQWLCAMPNGANYNGALHSQHIIHHHSWVELHNHLGLLNQYHFCFLHTPDLALPCKICLQTLRFHHKEHLTNINRSQKWQLYEIIEVSQWPHCWRTQPHQSLAAKSLPRSDQQCYNVVIGPPSY